MSRRQPNRQTRASARPNRAARRGLEVVFWIIFVLALGVGGPGAIAGLPALAEAVTPAPIPEAQASVEWHDYVVQPLSKIVSAPAPKLPVPAAVPAPAAVDVAALPAKPKPKPYSGAVPVIAIVIDDMGNDVVQNRRAIALPKEVSLSFLPQPADTPRLVEEAHRAGHEILVHVPMEAPRPNDTSLRLALRRDLPAEENVRRLEWALSRVPGHAGINNHEGSLFTADRLALIPVAEALYGRGVFFLDSRTTPLTQIVPVARAFGVPSSDRDVFLDDDQSSPAVAAQLRELEKVARTQGVAIAIGHPHAATLDLVTRWCETQNGFRLIPASTAIRLKTRWEMGVELARK
jgi:polysaccharide deacetylase 2 family uncharacterized protein YibQ